MKKKLRREESVPIEKKGSQREELHRRLSNSKRMMIMFLKQMTKD